MPAPDPVRAAAAPTELVENFFRHEAGRLHGALTRRLGIRNLELVEDVVQEAMLRALRTWSMGGVPPNPSAWISRVAHNLALDALRHRGMSAAKEDAIVTHLEQTSSAASAAAPDAVAAAIAADEHAIHDDALRLLFVSCHPLLAPDAQVVLALKVLCGFDTAEIARAFLGTEAAIEKQLTRTKQRLRDASVPFELPEGEQLAPRLGGVLATLYLLFNEGYKASSGDRLLREDLCREAIRLATLLVAHPAGDTPAAHALLALMLFNAARFPTRVDEQGELLRLDVQDRAKWDHALIDRGLRHLVVAAQGEELTEYHIQAGIAACHCLAPDTASTDWARILGHYDELLRIKPSPVVALNRAVAVANLHGAQAGLDAIAAMPGRERLDSHYLVHAVTGELRWRLRDHRAAAESFRRALNLAQVGPEQLHLTRMLERIEDAAGTA
ncbi:MAG: sigma-70 family RNA polymerase sigma factor [Burkholderiales bacterium]|nr:sigma-70 family RNA polymerase sigma factor [Opitutaceae bacterium]